MPLETVTKSNDFKTRSVFKINPIMLVDQGTYRCISNNGLGSQLINEVHLKIKGDKS